jgi:excisionase family DNA binding protein
MPDLADAPHLMTVREVAQLLRISRSFAYELVARGELESVRLGRRVLVPTTSVHQLVATATATATAESRAQTASYARGTGAHTGLRGDRPIPPTSITRVKPSHRR